MEGVFEVSFGPTFGTLRRYRFRTYRKLPRPIGLRLEEWETNRLFRRLIAVEDDFKKRQSLEHEHMLEQAQIDQQRATYISDRVWSKAHRMYIETPPLTGKDDDANWQHGAPRSGTCTSVPRRSTV